jgi:hypothetical protein
MHYVVGVGHNQYYIRVLVISAVDHGCLSWQVAAADIRKIFSAGFGKHLSHVRPSCGSLALTR